MLESVERIVEAYAQRRKGLATIARIPCDGQQEIGLLAIDPAQPSRRFQIECGVSVSTGKPDRHAADIEVQTLRTRRGFEAFVQRRFGSEAVIRRLKDYGVADGGPRRIVVTWEANPAVKAAAESADVELWSLQSLSQDMLQAFGHGRQPFADEAMRLLKLFAQAKTSPNSLSKTGKAKDRPPLAELWKSRDLETWDHYEGERYEADVKPEIRDVERSLERPGLRARLGRMSAAEFQDFLRSEYYRFAFVSKPRFLGAVRALDRLVRQGRADVLERVRLRLVNRDYDSQGDALRMIIGRHGGIPGLAMAEASALLALVYPEDFAMVDAVVAKALQEIGLPEVMKANPQDISVEEAETMIEILRLKAVELNRAFNAFQWTPRRVGRVLRVAGR